MEERDMSQGKQIAEIQVIQDAVRPYIKVVVPRGTSFEHTLKLQGTLSDLLGKLKGCSACNSGMPIWFQEREELEHIIRIDLDTLKPVG
jgi:hypothetical protein